MDNKSGDKIDNVKEDIVNFGAYQESLMPQGKASVDAEKVLGSMNGNIEVAPEIDAGTELGKIEVIEQQQPAAPAVVENEEHISADSIEVSDRGLNRSGVEFVEKNIDELRKNDKAYDFYNSVRSGALKMADSFKAGKMGKVA